MAEPQSCLQLLAKTSWVMPDLGRGMWRANISPAQNPASAEPAIRARCVKTLLSEVV